MPVSVFKSVWNVLLIFLLIYTATYMPYKTCFIDNSSEASDIIDHMVDALFTADIIVNFLSAVELSDGTLAYQPKAIAVLYIRSWFFFDVAAVFPIQLIMNALPKDHSESQKYIDEMGNEIVVDTGISNGDDYN